jgi:hypothetical protein
MDKIQNSLGPKTSVTNRLLLALRPGEVVTSARLREIGVSARLASYLKNTGILSSLGVGAYVRGQEEPNFTSAIQALTHQLRVPVHIGGRTALELQGVTQYLTIGKSKKVWLLTSKRAKFPPWFAKLQWDARPQLVQTNFLKHRSTAIIRSIVVDGFDVPVSCRELAILETIFLIGKSHRFEEVDDLFEALTTLDAGVLQGLLENCQSIRVCRIFLFLARKHAHPWTDGLNESKIELGSGKRVVVNNGRLDTRYQITVPAGEVEPDV